MIKHGFARLADGATWLSTNGVAVLAGIGFTMSFFTGSLAYPSDDIALMAATRVGVLAGSLLCAVVGYSLLRMCSATTISLSSSAAPGR